MFYSIWIIKIPRIQVNEHWKLLYLQNKYSLQKAAKSNKFYAQKNNRSNQ